MVIMLAISLTSKRKMAACMHCSECRHSLSAHLNNMTEQKLGTRLSQTLHL